MTVLDPVRLQQIVQPACGLPPEEAVPEAERLLVDALGELVLPGGPWFFSNAGGIMGSARLLFASPKEYLLFFSTPIGSEGHSGRHRAHIWDVVLTGELHTYQEHELRALDLRPGDLASLPPGTSNGSRLEPGTVLLEYARGNIPSMLPFGLLDAFTSTLDLAGIAATFRAYTEHNLRALTRGLRR